MDKENDRPISLYLFCILFTAYVLTSSECSYFHADASYLRFEVVKALMEDGDLAIPAGMGFTGEDGRDYSWLGLGAPLTATPFYLLGSLLGIRPEIPIAFINPLFTAATAVLMLGCVRRLGYSERIATTVALCYGLGTFAWPLAKQPFDHPQETFFLLLAVSETLRFKTSFRRRHLVVAGGAIGMAILTRPTTVLVLPALAALLLVRSSRRAEPIHLQQIATGAMAAILAATPFVTASLWYNAYRFGSPFETGYGLFAERAGVDFFFGTDLAVGLAGFLASPAKGFFFYSPVTILGVLGFMPFFSRHRNVAISFLLVILAYLLFLSGNIYWHGDWTWGPRYLLAITPYLTIPAAALLAKGRRAVMLLVTITFGLGLLIQFIGTAVDFNKHFYDMAYVEGVAFEVVSGEGVQSIHEPELATYFDWEHAPITSHVQTLFDYAASGYRPPEAGRRDSPLDRQNYQNHPRMNLFDYWWVFEAVQGGNRNVFPLLLAMLFFVAVCGARLALILTAPERGSR